MGKNGAFACILLLEKGVTQYPFCTLRPKRIVFKGVKTPLKIPYRALRKQGKRERQREKAELRACFFSLAFQQKRTERSEGAPQTPKMRTERSEGAFIVELPQLQTL